MLSNKRNVLAGALTGALIISLAFTASTQYTRAESLTVQLESAYEQIEDYDQLNDELQDSLDTANAALAELASYNEVIELNALARYNELGGYVPACGELPGVLGDDC